MMLIALALGALPCVDPPAKSDVPEELGTVSWGRDHDAVFDSARSTDRPVLLLFQEIPG